MHQIFLQPGIVIHTIGSGRRIYQVIYQVFVKNVIRKVNIEF